MFNTMKTVKKLVPNKLDTLKLINVDRTGGISSPGDGSPQFRSK